MLEALAATGAAVALAPAALGPRTFVVPVILSASALSLATSAAGLFGAGRSSGGLSLVESFALIALVFFALRRDAGRAATAAAVVAGVAVVCIIPAHATSPDSLLVNAAGMALWGFGALVAAGCAAYLDSLDARRAHAVAHARRDQRLALARDLHDFVAHDVSAIVVQAQAAKVVGLHDRSQAVAALERIEQAGLHALSAMDRALAALRDTPPPGLVDLRALTARFAPSGGLRVELELDDEIAGEVAPQVGSAAYRLVSEALTNVRRHAPAATRVSVAVSRATLGAERAIAVTVTNDGAMGPTPTREGGGYGLAGVREHVGALGGTVRTGHVGDGRWQLVALLPATPA